MILRIILVALSILVSACSTSLHSINNSDAIKKGEGVFLTKLQANYPFQLSLKNSSDETIWLGEKFLDRKNVLLAVSLPNGKYSIHKINWKNGESTFSGNETFKFLIKEGKVNYICDFGVYFKLKNGDVLAAEFTPVLKLVLPFYSKQFTEKEFKERYPDVFKKYLLIASPMSKCVRGESKKALQLKELLN